MMRAAVVPPMTAGKARKAMDFCTEAGARQLAAVIEQAWHAIGHPEVSVWIEPSPVRYNSKKSGREMQSTIWMVKTDLINGLPRRIWRL